MDVLTPILPSSRGSGVSGRSAEHVGWKIAALGVLAAWLLFVGAHHEPWLDECQAWLIARDSSLRQLIVERVRYEGTPALWHLILWLCIRCGLPFAALHLVSTACVLAGAAVLLWRAPFPAPLRILLVASYWGAYQYAVVARSYALDAALVPALAALFARRAERPLAYGVLIGLLANCNVHSLLLATVLGGEWMLALWRGRRLRGAAVGLVVAVALGLFAILVAWQPADNGFLQPGTRPPPVASALLFVSEAFVDRLAFLAADAPTPVARLHGILASLLLLIPSVLAFRRAGALPWVAASAAALIGFSAIGYVNAWHSGILFMAWLFGLWVSWPALAGSLALARAVVATVAVVGTVQAAEAARTGLADVAHAYSGAPGAASALAGWRLHHPNARIGAAGFKTFAVQPYFAANPFANYRGGDGRISYIVWKRGEAWRPFDPVSAARAATAAGCDALLLSRYEVGPRTLAAIERDGAGRGYILAATFPGTLFWKGYAREDDTLLLFTGRGR